MVIPCLCSFTALRTLAAEPPVNKQRTRTLFRKESGSYNLGRRSYGSGNRGLSNRPLDGLLTALRAAALFSSCKSPKDTGQGRSNPAQQGADI